MTTTVPRERPAARSRAQPPPHARPVAPDGLPPLHAHVLALQRAAGNRATTAALAGALPYPVLQRAPSVKYTGRAQGRVRWQALGALTTEVLDLLLQQEADVRAARSPDFEVQLDGKTFDEFFNEARATLRQKQHVSGTNFNVRGRSDNPTDVGDIVVCTDDKKLAEIAAKSGDTGQIYGLGAVPWVEETLVNSGGYRSVLAIDKRIHVYMARGVERLPLANRVTAPPQNRPLPAAPSSATAPLANTQGVLHKVTPGKTYVIEVTLTSPCRRGHTATNKKTAMAGRTALAYAIETGVVPAQTPLNMEWLHLWGSALGGPNALGNLVAGSFDANTEMLPVEHAVARMAKTAVPHDARTHIVYRVEADLEENSGKETWVARSVRQIVSRNNQVVLYSTTTGLSVEPMARTKFDLLEELMKEWAPQ